jgi:alpha-galactosidase
MQRDLSFEDGLGLKTTRWLHRRTATNVLPTRLHGAPDWNMEFSVVIDGRVILNSRAPELRLISAALRGETLTLTLEAEGVRVEIDYTAYQNHPVLRKGLRIQNLRAEPITLTHLILESLELCVGHPDDQALSAFYAVQPRELFVSGRSEDPAIYQRNVHTGEGFVAMNEVPGIIKRTNTSWTWQGSIQLLYDTDIFPFERTLSPGEVFSTAKVSIAFTQEDTEAAPRWVIPSYASEVLHKKGAGFNPPWIYNTWETFFRDIDQPLIETLIPLAAQMGFDIFTVDDGWQAMMGSSAIRASHFPKGLHSIRERVESHGMRLGLWLALAVADSHAPVVLEHPEWVCWDGTLKPRHTFTMSGSAPVMCLSTPYREFITAQISEIISAYHLAYIKLDLTTVFNAYGEGPGCFASGHEHHTWAESLVRTYENIQAVTAALYAQFPDLLIDLTFELWGQKHLIDYGLLAAGDLDWLSNIHDLSAAGPRQARTLLYQRSLAMPVDAMLIGNLQADIEPVAERFATAIGSAPLLLGDLRRLTPDQIAWYRAKVDWFKQLRREVPIQHSFFALGAWMQPNAAEWDGFARLSRDGEGIVVIFRNSSPDADFEVKIPVFSETVFHLRSAMTGRSLGTVSAEQFRRGLRLPFIEPVEIIEVRTARG